MSTIGELLEANRSFAETFDKGDLPMPPARNVAIVACMDARLHPRSSWCLEIGDAHVIRNAGGRASDDALRSLIISSHLLGTREVAVIHHTDCGMLTFTNEDMVSKRGTTPRASTSCPSPTRRAASGTTSRGSATPRSSPTASPCPATSTRSRPAASARW